MPNLVQIGLKMRQLKGIYFMHKIDRYRHMMTSLIWRILHLVVTMANTALMLIDNGAKWGEFGVKFPSFDTIYSMIKKLSTRYDVTKNVYVTLIRHLVVGMCILIDDDADFDANQAKIATAMNNVVYTLKLPVYCYMMTSPILSMWHPAVTISIHHVRLLTNELRDSSESMKHLFTIEISVSLINWL